MPQVTGLGEIFDVRVGWWKVLGSLGPLSTVTLRTWGNPIPLQDARNGALGGRGMPWHLREARKGMWPLEIPCPPTSRRAPP